MAMASLKSWLDSLNLPQSSVGGGDSDDPYGVYSTQNRGGSGLLPQIKAAAAAQGVKTLKKGGKVSSASSRADGIAQRGKTKGRMC